MISDPERKPTEGEVAAVVQHLNGVRERALAGEWAYDPEHGDGDLARADSEDTKREARIESERQRIASRVWSCKACGALHVEADLLPGRGKRLGEHPCHQYARTCGHSITWHGRRLVADFYGLTPLQAASLRDILRPLMEASPDAKPAPAPGPERPLCLEEAVLATLPFIENGQVPFAWIVRELRRTMEELVESARDRPGDGHGKCYDSDPFPFEVTG